MSGPRIGELFAGYGGLGMGVQAVYGGEIAWVSDICRTPTETDASTHFEPHRDACRILAHRFPGVPNHGDITTIDWSTVEPVDILTGGSPCQDLSHAGRRAGMTEGTRSNLWVAMREAIAQLRPRTVVWENVRGAFSAAADSAVEPCAGCVGDRPGVHLRALGRVLGDLSDLGYDCRWHGLRAADVGAPHGRFRVFVVATDTTRNAGRIAYGDGAAAALTADLGHEWAGSARDGRAGPADGDSGAVVRTANPHGLHLSDASFEDATPVSLMGTPTARMWKGSGPVGSDSHTWLLEHGNVEAQVLLLPTPAVNDMGEGKTVERWDEWTADMQAKHGNGNGHGKSLAIEAQRLLPTPSAMAPDAKVSDRARELYSSSDRLADIVEQSRWGDYAAAIARWERVLGRPAPAPTMTSVKGNPQLSPAFVEWMMGLPAGWVTDVPGITRNEALKALGNGVCPQQAAAALRTMLAWSEVAA